eukprot:TRINITY_DN3310_c0_g3_i1.p1 TRINITY_DN3310_c0_g3~~TRINITY_DN3310_c0_g3_i1.p1  ORF type:complete len:1201 (-),score=285.64 TRINITY_DN3310_c0_g3_i1:56-3658(-)
MATRYANPHARGVVRQPVRPTVRAPIGASGANRMATQHSGGTPSFRQVTTRPTTYPRPVAVQQRGAPSGYRASYGQHHSQEDDAAEEEALLEELDEAAAEQSSAPAGHWQDQAGSESQASGEGSRILRFTAPAEWVAEDVQYMCVQYGTVDNVSPEEGGEPGVFLVTMLSPEEALRTVAQLNNTDSGQGEILGCELLGQEAPADESMEELFQVYVDELHTSTSPSGPQACEIYLTNLPLQDYTPEQFRDWLGEFCTSNPLKSFYQLQEGGTPQDRGYVRFPSHEEAQSLILAIEEMNDEEGVRGTWSLSEQMCTRAGPYGPDVTSRFSAKLRTLQQELQCSHLFLAGDFQPNSLRQAEQLGLSPPGGALHVVVQSSSPKEELTSRLQQALIQSLVAPAPRAAPAAGRAAPSGRPTPAAAPAHHAPRSAPSVAKARVHEPSAPEPPLMPCVIVRGIANSWAEQQVKLIFAVFGGVSRVQIAEDAQGRLARVQLRKPDNMQKAADQLDNTQVGDGDEIEECTITCELCGVTPPTRAIFVDELDMSCRPSAAPSKQDREVFMKNLPVQDGNDCLPEADIRGWLEGFGKVEDMHLLRKVEGGPSGQGYVRFREHEGAVECIKAHADVEDELDVSADWSESERVLQGASSIYGYDVHKGLTDSVLETVKKAAKVKTLWMLSESRPSSGPKAPKVQGKQLHFISECSDQEFEELKSQLQKVLGDLHQELSSKRAKAAEGEKRRADQDEGKSKSRRSKDSKGERREPEKPPGSFSQASGGAQPWSHPPPGGPPAGPPPSAPPPGYPPPGYPPAHGWRPGGWPPAPAPGWPGHPPPPGHWQGHPAAHPPATGSAWGYPSYPSGPPGPPKGGNSQSASSGATAGSKSSAPALSPDMQAKVDEGEAFVKEGKELKEKQSYKKALNKISKGLKILVNVVNDINNNPALKDTQPELSKRVDEYLAEAERLKELSKQAPPAAGAPPPQAPSHTSGPPPLDEESRRKLESGTQKLKEAEELEARGDKEKALPLYIKGLQMQMEVMADKRYNDHPALAKVKEKVQMYIERAEQLKRPNSGGAGGDRRSSQEAGSRGGSERDRRRDDRGSHHGRRERSRSRDKPRHRSQSRSRGAADGHDRSRGRHRSRSRSRGGSRKDGPPVRARGASPPKAQAECTRPKGAPPARPPGMDGDGEPKRGAALLVGKAAMRRPPPP